MSPSYRDGDYVLTLRYGRRRPRVGDDVVYSDPDLGLLLKRVDHLDHTGLTVRGLNTLSADSASLGPVAAARFPELNRVVFHFPRA